MVRRRLRVGLVPVAGAAPRQGHGRVWQEVLRRLADDVRLVSPERARQRWRRPAVWLSSGHQAPPPGLAGPRVAVVHESGRVPPEHAPYVPQEIVDVLGPATDAGLAGADLVLVPSEASAAEVERYHALPRERIRVVADGVDPGLFHPGRATEPNPVERALGRRVPYVVFAARPFPRKNLPALRAAMTDLAARGYPHHLVVAGGPLDQWPLGDVARQVDAELPGAPGRVLWLQDLTDPELATVLAGADAFCLPSFFEGFGLTALEAMACGTPVVVSDGGALPEVVGDAGLVVAPTADAVRDALQRLLDDRALAERLARAGRRRAEGLTWERTAAGWRAVLEEAAGILRTWPAA